MMNDTSLYDGTVERTADGGVIRFERTLPHSIDDVWGAITTPEGLGQWWLPFDADITVDLRVGGEIVMASRGGEGITLTCSILRLEAPALLEHTHADPGSFLRWELESTEAGCVLRLSHFVTDLDAALGKGFLVGLHTSLGRLAPCLEGRPIAWDDDRFEEARAHYAQVGLAPSAPVT
jgi:uncharacterized protein YndB with AHSA1/START domain